MNMMARPRPGLWAYGHHPRVLPRRRRGPAAAAGHRPGPSQTVRRSTRMRLIWWCVLSSWLTVATTLLGPDRLRGPRSRWCTSTTSTGSPSTATAAAAAMESRARQAGEDQGRPAMFGFAGTHNTHVAVFLFHFLLWPAIRQEAALEARRRLTAMKSRSSCRAASA